jgi:hypothetical protein
MNKLALEIEETYRAPRDVRHGLIPFLSESLTGPDRTIARSAAKRGAVSALDLAGEEYPGELRLSARYGGLDKLWTFLLSSVYGGRAVYHASGVYRSEHRLLDDETPSAIVGIEKGVSIWQLAGCQIAAGRIHGEPGKPVEIALTARAASRQRDHSPNTVSTGWAIPGRSDLCGTGIMCGDGTTCGEQTAPPSRYPLIFFQQLAFQIGAASGSMSGMAIRQFDVDIRFEMEREIAAGGRALQQGRRREPTITFDLMPRGYVADTWLDWMDDETELKAKFLFSGSALDGEHNNELTIWLPRLRVAAAVASANRAGSLDHPITMRALCPASVPSGFPAGAAREIFIETQHWG